MADSLKKFLNTIILKTFSKPSILFESTPIFSDNTKAVFDLMVRRHYDKKYNFFWYVDWDKCAFLDNGVVKYINLNDRKTIKQKLLRYSYYFKTRCIICCNRFIPSSGEGIVTFGPNQISFYLSHGNPIKSVKNYYFAPEGIDYALSTSDKMKRIVSYEFNIDIKKIFVAGFPRNDVFSLPSINIRDRLKIDFKKIVVWFPTYRQKSTGSIDLPGSSLPLIHDTKNAVTLNEIAKNENVLIILKPHFAQDVSKLSNISLSNIMMIDDYYLEMNRISSYELLAASDGLLTDYSSVYFDYTLSDKPIGVIWEDIDTYRENPGFALDLDYYLKGAVKIYNLDQLCSFIRNVSNDIDDLQAERREIRDVVNISTDGKNAERVVDYITEKVHL